MPDANDLKNKMLFDRHITSARVFLKRGDMAKAGESVVQALELRPGDPDARELAADLVFAAGDLEKAAAHYKALFSPEKPRPSAEDKYARVVLRIAEEKYEREMLMQMVANPQKFSVGGRNPVLAAIASIGPGFGQIYLGDFRRGAILFGVTMLSWLLFYYSTPPVGGLVDVRDRLSLFFSQMSPGAVVFACVAVFTHVYAFIDAVISSGKKPGPSMPEMTSSNEKQNNPGPQ